MAQGAVGGSRATIEKLSAAHRFDDFDCGAEELNRFIKRFALVNQQADAAQTFVALDQGRVIGYYTLAAGAVVHADAPPRAAKGLARHPIPVMVLARLAVDNAAKGRGVGKGLLKDALLRTARAAEIAGMRALVVHAKDEEAARFYRHFNFDPSPTDPFHLFLLMKELRKLAGGA